MIEHTKPGSAMERVKKKFDKAFCFKCDKPPRRDMKYAVKASGKSPMILATGQSAEIAWNRAAKAVENDNY